MYTYFTYSRSVFFWSKRWYWIHIYVSWQMHNYFSYRKTIILYTCIVLHFSCTRNNICKRVISIPNMKATFLFKEALESLPESWLVFLFALDAAVCLSVVVLPEPHKWRLDSIKAIHQFNILSIFLHYDHYLKFLFLTFQRTKKPYVLKALKYLTTSILSRLNITRWLFKC